MLVFILTVPYSLTNKLLIFEIIALSSFVTIPNLVQSTEQPIPVPFMQPFSNSFNSMIPPPMTSLAEPVLPGPIQVPLAAQSSLAIVASSNFEADPLIIDAYEPELDDFDVKMGNADMMGQKRDHDWLNEPPSEVAQENGTELNEFGEQDRNGQSLMQQAWSYTQREDDCSL